MTAVQKQALAPAQAIPVKIAIVGGGSYSWGPLFVRDLLFAPELAQATIVLHDIDLHALDTVYGLAQRIAAAYGRGVIERTTVLDEALAGADFVILTITTGGLEAMRYDLEIPEKYGVYHSVGDTVGPGGIARALRNIPVVVDLAQRMERLCPNAWLLNYTNPLTVLCRAVTRTSSIRTIGLCHEWHGVRNRLARYWGVPVTGFKPRIAGINHLIWLLDLTIEEPGQGVRNAMPDLVALADLLLARRGPVANFTDDDPRSTIDRGLVKAQLLKLYGALPAAGDRHVAEFFPFFLTPATDFGRAWGIERTSIAERQDWRAEAWQMIADLACNDRSLAPLLAAPSGEAAGEIVSAVMTGGSYQGIMNLPNRGQIANLPADVIVETLGVVDGDGARGLPVGAVPEAIQAILQRHIATQELTVAAALEGSRALALQALLNDPLCPPDLSSAERMLEDLLAAHATRLPQFA